MEYNSTWFSRAIVLCFTDTQSGGGGDGLVQQVAGIDMVIICYKYRC